MGGRQVGARSATGPAGPRVFGVGLGSFPGFPNEGNASPQAHP